MSYSVKNKLLIWAVVLLVIANIATIATFWFGSLRPSRLRPEQPAEYLIKEIGFDSTQKNTYLQLVKDHQKQSEKLQREIKTAKDHFFELLQQRNLSDSAKRMAAITVSELTRELDLLTFDHFQKVRNICTVDQQEKFDAIIHEVINMVGGPGQRGMHGPNGSPPGRESRPPRGGEDGPPPGR